MPRVGFPRVLFPASSHLIQGSAGGEPSAEGFCHPYFLPSSACNPSPPQPESLQVCGPVLSMTSSHQVRGSVRAEKQTPDMIFLVSWLAVPAMLEDLLMDSQGIRVLAKGRRFLAAPRRLLGFLTAPEEGWLWAQSILLPHQNIYPSPRATFISTQTHHVSGIGA